MATPAAIWLLRDLICRQSYRSAADRNEIFLLTQLPI